MLIALIGRDKPGALQTRMDNRDAHVAYLKSTGVVSQAGPPSGCRRADDRLSGGSGCGRYGRRAKLG